LVPAGPAAKRGRLHDGLGSESPGGLKAEESRGSAPGPAVRERISWRGRSRAAWESLGKARRPEQVPPGPVPGRSRMTPRPRGSRSKPSQPAHNPWTSGLRPWTLGPGRAFPSGLCFDICNSVAYRTITNLSRDVNRTFHLSEYTKYCPPSPALVPDASGRPGGGAAAEASGERPIRPRTGPAEWTAPPPGKPEGGEQGGRGRMVGGRGSGPGGLTGPGYSWASIATATLTRSGSLESLRKPSS